MNLVEIVKSPQAFPALIIALQACAALRYAAAGNVWQSLYWAFAVGLNSVCTFGMLGR